jgi:hypothetical protein
VAHWNFNGNANDVSGKGHNGVPQNVTQTAGRAGKPNTAYLFNGTSSKIKVPYQADLNLSKFSICAVVKMNGFYTDLCQGNRILERGTEYGNGNYLLQFTDNAIDSSCSVTGDTSMFNYSIGRGNTPTYNKPWQSTNFLRSGSWHCVVGTFNDTVFKLYVDGVLQTTVAPASSLGVGTSNEGISIGASSFGDTTLYPYWFNGLMDDLRLYDRALTASEVLTFCGNPDDTTANTTGRWCSL